MKELKTLKFSNQEEPYEIVDAYAREQLKENQDTLASKEELQNTKEELENQIVAGLKPPPSVTSHSRPTSIPIISGMQLIFYAACAGTLTLTMGNKIYTHTLTSPNDVGWTLWVQTGETDGSFISPSGSRTYLEVGSKISSANVSFSFNSEDYSGSDPNYIVITIE